MRRDNEPLPMQENLGLLQVRHRIFAPRSPHPEVWTRGKFGYIDRPRQAEVMIPVLPIVSVAVCVTD